MDWRGSLGWSDANAGGESRPFAQRLDRAVALELQRLPGMFRMAGLAEIQVRAEFWPLAGGPVRGGAVFCRPRRLHRGRTQGNLKGAQGMKDMENRGARLRVGIVGSGVAGSSAAYYVRQMLGSQAEIVVYERSQTVGGRVQEMEIAGKMVAIGASVAHSANRYFVRLVEALGLHPERYAIKRLGVWNGHRFDFRTSGKRWPDLVRALGRYGMSPLRAERLVQQFVRQLIRAYDLLDEGRGFASPQELFGALGLYELSQQSSADYFRRQGVSDRFLHEMIDGISRGNYGQASDIHAMVNLVSLAGAALGGYLISVREGNSMVCCRLLQAAGATVRTGTEVAEIACLGAADRPGAGSAAAPGQPAARYRVSTAAGEEEPFDAVIMATPLELAGIRFTGTALPAQSLLTRPFQVTHVTFVVGQISPGYFGLRTEELPETIMTRESPAIPFSSIGTWGKAADSGDAIYKVFSRQEMSEEFLSQIFPRRLQTRKLVWKAYPVLRPAAQWPPFVLNEGLYYVNAMESGVSTMETEIMASRNVVNLLVRDRRPAAARTAARTMGGDGPQ